MFKWLRYSQGEFDNYEPSGHYIYHQFNIQQFYLLLTQTVFTCFVWISEQTAIISVCLKQIPQKNREERQRPDRDRDRVRDSPHPRGGGGRTASVNYKFPRLCPLVLLVRVVYTVNV